MTGFNEPWLISMFALVFTGAVMGLLIHFFTPLSRYTKRAFWSGIYISLVGLLCVGPAAIVQAHTVHDIMPVLYIATLWAVFITMTVITLHFTDKLHDWLAARGFWLPFSHDPNAVDVDPNAVDVVPEEKVETDRDEQ